MFYIFILFFVKLFLHLLFNLTHVLLLSNLSSFIIFAFISVYEKRMSVPGTYFFLTSIIYSTPTFSVNLSESFRKKPIVAYKKFEKEKTSAQLFVPSIIVDLD